MITPAEAGEFAAALRQAAVLYDRTMSSEQITAYWRVLAPRMSMDMLRAAIDLHAADPQAGRYFPRPADLLAQVPTAHPRTGHLPPDAAWAIALESYDEAHTVVWTDEIAQARDLARPIWAAGDVVGARMAFRAVYEQAVRHRPTPTWWVSAGHDPQLRAEAIERAVAYGWLTEDPPGRCLPPPPGGTLDALLATTRPEAETVRARIAELRRAIVSAHAAPPAEPPRRRREGRTAEQITAALRERAAMEDAA